MTFDELRKAASRPARMLEGLVLYAEEDDFSPSVVRALERAAYFARLTDSAVAEAMADVEAELHIA